MKTRWVAWGSTIAVLAMLLVPAANAQLEIGDNVKMNMNGMFGFAYGGGWGTFGGSNRHLGFVGNGTLNGSYYHPNFISFNLMPYYNRSQANAATRSTLNNSGVNGSANFFTGSYFPGSISFGKEFNSSGEFGIPGIGGLTTNGSARNFGITWSALLPNLPTLTATYSSNSSHSTLLGVDGDFESAFKSLSLDSRYTLKGFDLTGYLTKQDVASSFPGFLGSASVSGQGSSTSYGATATHRIPLAGTFSASWNRTSYDSEDNSYGETTTNTLGVGATISPFTRLTFSGDVRYTSNLFAGLERDLFNGGSVPVLLEDIGAKSLIMNATGYYSVGKGFFVVGNLAHRQQSYRGVEYSDTRYGGTLNYRYSRPLLGMLYFSFGLVDTATKEGNSSLGFVGNMSFSRKFGRTEASADFSYSQNMMTQVAFYTTSSYSYGGYLRRRLTMNTTVNGSFRAMHSALTQNPGDLNRSETFSTGMNWRRYGVSGSYSQSTGTSVITPSGILNPTPLPPSLITKDFVVFNGRSYTLGVHGTPVKKMVVTAYYTKVKSDTLLRSLYSLNDGERYNAELEYKVRKLSLRMGYTRTEQMISSSGAPNSVVNSYFLNVSRWFNVF